MRTDISREICERGVLGCLCKQILLPSMLKEEFFNDPMNLTIYRAIKKLESKKLPYTYIDVFEYLEKLGSKIQFDYLAELDMTTIVALSSNYLNNLEKYYNQRNLLVGLQSIQQDLEKKEPEQIIQEIHGLLKNNFQNNLLPVSSRADDIFIEEEYKTMFKSGFPSIDKVVDFVPDTFYVLAGITGTGKTSFCLNIINNVLLQNKKVLFFSLEMSEKKILNRLSAVRTQDYINKMRDCPKLPREICSLFTNFYLSAPCGCSFERIFIDSMKVKPDLIVVDSSTRISTANEFKNPTIHFSEIAKKGKELTRMAECPVILIVHMNRDIFKVERKPKVSDLYGSTSFEQQADIIHFLWQEESDKKEPIATITNIIAKNRDESAVEFNLEFIKTKSIFREFLMGV